MYGAICRPARTFVVVLCAALTFVPTMARAQSSDTDARTALATMRFYAGQWYCRGLIAATDTPISFTSAVTLTQNGLTFRTVSAASDVRSGLHEVTSGEVSWRYEADAKRWVSEQSDGGVLEATTSSGWVGSDLVWTGFMRSGDRRTPYRNTLRKAGEAEVRSLTEAADASGALKPVSATVCKKTRVSVGSK